MGVRHIAMVTVQVRDFDGMVAWYRDVLGLGIGWLEAGEFCTLTMPGGEAVLALATDHPDRISDRPGTGWTPGLTVDDRVECSADLPVPELTGLERELRHRLGDRHILYRTLRAAAAGLSRTRKSSRAELSQASDRAPWACT